MSADTVAVPQHDGYVFDLDGTIYLGERLLPHAKEAIGALKARGARVLFLSNKPLERREAYAAKLTRLGIPTTPDEVINSSLVMARYLTRQKRDARLFVIGEPPLLEELEAAGLHVVSDPDVIVSGRDRGAAQPSGSSRRENRPDAVTGTGAYAGDDGQRPTHPSVVDYVVVAMDRSLRYAQLDAALVALRNGAKLVATNPDTTCPVEGGEIPDTGATLAAIYAASGIRPEAITGKPDPLMVNTALEWLRLPAARCLIAGDRIETDIRMGTRAGMSTALLMTGVTTPEVLRASELVPDYVLNDLSGLVPELRAEWASAPAVELKERAQ